MVFGTYLGATGAFILVAPGTFTDLLSLPDEGHLYLRVAGLLAAALGFYYVTAARDENIPFMRRSVIARAIFGSMLAVVGITSGEPLIAAFAIPDYLSAYWTWTALKASQ